MDGGFLYLFPRADFPLSASRDLSQYKLLILRTYQKFSNRVWLACGRAFREHAAATNLTDWSNMNMQLFNFHAAGASTHGHGEFANESAERAGAPCSQIVCKSWNRGRCPLCPMSFFASLFKLFWVSSCLTLPWRGFHNI